MSVLQQSPQIARETRVVDLQEFLREENDRLKEENSEAIKYIREKVDELLEVVGTESLRPEELDDHSLIEFDPIGIVAKTFRHILQNLKETNLKLQFAHDQIQTVFETVGAAILVLDPQGRVVSYNQKTRDLLLGEDVDICGKTCEDHVCRRKVKEEECVFQLVMRSRREQRYTDWILKERVFDVIGRPMLDERGEVAFVVIAYQDVSARRSSQNELLQALSETRAANDKIHGILRAAGDGILVTDAEDNLVLVNRRAEELVGLSTTGSGAPSRIDNIPHRRLSRLLLQARQYGLEPYGEDLTFEPPGHSPAICQARVTAIRSPANEFNGCITILHDVTEQRAIDRMKNEFVSTAAHELRTPLAAIIGYADLLLMEGDFIPEQKTEFLEQIQKKSERLGDIVSDLLDISRIESGEGVQLDPKPHRVDQLCEEIARSYQLQSNLHTIDVDFAQARSITAVFDRFAMAQVLENLLSNSVKYSPGGGEVRIVGRLEEGKCVLEVSDQGIGMTSEQVARVYEKFYRADATNTAISGTGLGMTIVKHLMEAQAGSVSIASTPGKGTTVTLVIPEATAC